MLVAVPFGLGSAIYLSEYAKPGVRRVLKPTLEILAGIPSVVLGFFALHFITPNVVRGLIPGAQSANFLAAGIAVGILTIPLVAAVSEDAMRAAPTRCGRSLTAWALNSGIPRYEWSFLPPSPASSRR